MIRTTRGTLLAVAALAVLLAAQGCLKKPRKEKLYFDELKPPVGFSHVKIVSDESKNPETGGHVTATAVVKPDEDRDELEVLMKSLYRQAAGRKSGFKKHKGKLEKIDIRLYDSESKAKAAGEDWLARVSRASRNSEESYENKQKLPLLKWGKKALGKGNYQLLEDHEALSLEYSDPFLDHEGKPVKKISYEIFANDFIRTTDNLFKKITQLKKFTYLRKHEDKVVAKIWLNREQFTGLNLRSTLEQKYNAVVGPLVQDLATRQITEAKYIKIKTKQLRKVMRELLEKLPKEQVELIKELR